MKSVRARLTVLNIAVFAVLLGLMGFFLRVKIESELFAGIDQDLRESAGQVVTGPDPDLPDDQTRPDRVAVPIGGFVSSGAIPKRTIDATVPIQIRSRGVVLKVQKEGFGVELKTEPNVPRLYPIGDNIPTDSQADTDGLKLALKGRAVFHNYSSKNEPFRSYSLPIFREGKVFAVEQTSRPLSPTIQALRATTYAIVVLLPLAAIAAALAGFVLVGAAMRPLRKLKDAAESLDADLSGRRLPVEGADEFSDLAITFNQAFDRTARAFADQQAALAQLERFTGDAAHELRTPIANVKGSVSHLLLQDSFPDGCRPDAESIERSADRMSKLVNDLLLLAKQDGGFGLRIEPDVVLATLIQEVCEELPSVSGIEVTMEVAPNLKVCVDPGAFSQIISNLVRNALTQACSSVRIEASSHPGGFSISVSDDGAGIPIEMIPKLGTRFFRIDDDRSRKSGGAGLGLAIVKSLTHAHCGSMHFESAKGQGTRVILRFDTSKCSQVSRPTRRIRGSW